jgi:hypothetical protein
MQICFDQNPRKRNKYVAFLPNPHSDQETGPSLAGSMTNINIYVKFKY